MLWFVSIPFYKGGSCNNNKKHFTNGKNKDKSPEKKIYIILHSWVFWNLGILRLLESVAIAGSKEVAEVGTVGFWQVPHLPWGVFFQGVFCGTQEGKKKNGAL